MVEFAERLAELRKQATDDRLALAEQPAASVASSFPATSDQLVALIKAELDVTDVPKPELVHKPASHGSPEADFAVAKYARENIWFAIPVEANPSNLLLGLVHCPNGHIIDRLYPNPGEDNWGPTLLRLAEAQDIYASGIECHFCHAMRLAVPPYQPKLP